MNNLCK